MLARPSYGRRPSMARARTAPQAEERAGVYDDHNNVHVDGGANHVDEAQVAYGIATVDLGDAGPTSGSKIVQQPLSGQGRRSPQYLYPGSTEASSSSLTNRVGKGGAAYTDRHMNANGEGFAGSPAAVDMETIRSAQSDGNAAYYGAFPRKGSTAGQAGPGMNNAQHPIMGTNGLPRASSSGPGSERIPSTMRVGAKASTAPSQRMPSIGGSGFAFGSIGAGSMMRGDTGSMLSGTTLTGSMQGASGEAGTFRETWFRRLSALMYLKQSLAGISQSGTAGRSAGQQPWLDSAKLTKRDMDMHDDPERMHKRTARKYMLGCSLAPALEIASATECARLVLSIMNEIDALPDGGEKDKARMRNFFKSTMRGRRTGGTDLANSLDGVGIGGPSSIAVSSNGFEFTGANVPFKLDFWQVVQTLFDILVEIYCKLGMALQTPGGATYRDDGMPVAGDSTANQASLADSMQKIDARVKKLFSQLVKEIDQASRRVVREELASMDPSLAREFGISDESLGSGIGGGISGVGTSSASASGSYSSRGFHSHMADMSA